MTVPAHLNRTASSFAGQEQGQILLVPIGATEQHGPHLPLTTDTDIAVALAEALAARLPDRVVIGPAVGYGSSGEHQSFPGTISIGAATTEQLVVELGRSATATWSRVLLLSTHGGNTVPLHRAVASLTAEGRDVRVWSPHWDGDAHAGHIETSLMLAINPGAVTMTTATAGNPAPLAELLPEMRTGGVAAVSANGILGDATTATAAAGRELLAAAVNELRELIEGWQ